MPHVVGHGTCDRCDGNRLKWLSGRGDLVACAWHKGMKAWRSRVTAASAHKVATMESRLAYRRTIPARPNLFNTCGVFSMRRAQFTTQGDGTANSEMGRGADRSGHCHPTPQDRKGKHFVVSVRGARERPGTR